MWRSIRPSRPEPETNPWLLLLHPEPTHSYAEDLAIAHKSLRPASYDNILSYGKVIQRNDRVLGGIILMMQLEAYRLEHGSYPEGLDALGVETLTPRGAPWLYVRLAPGADPDGRLYLLYLPGGDGIDNGGVSDGSISRPGSVRDGADWILNKVRRRDE